MIALDYRLRLGNIAQTAYVIPSRVEDNVTLAGIIDNALELESEQSGRQFVLFDDFGRLTLSERAALDCGVRLDAGNVGGVRFSSSADGRSNRVKVSRYDRRRGTREIRVASDPVSEARLGILQHYVRIGARSEVRLDEQAAAVLRLRNRDARTLTVRGAAGDVRVRGGSLVSVDLPEFSGKASAARCLHRFSAGGHFMDLELGV
jgi:hypothetical protein